MTGEALFVCGLLLATIIVFVSDKVRLDVVALLVVVILAVSGVLTPGEAVAGFGDTVVVLIAGLFVVGEALSRTGVAAAIGAWLMRTSTGGAIGLQIRLMLIVALLSAFMSSTGAVAVFIPVAMGLARRSGIPAKRLLLPMAYAALMGGTLTLIGTPPNIVASGALEDAGLAPFGFFEFTPIGLAVLAGGILYLVTIGARLLPTGEEETSSSGEERSMNELLAGYELAGRVLLMAVEASSTLVGRSLGEAELGSRTGFSVVAVQRRRRFGGDDVLVADRNTILRAGDALLVVAPTGRTEPAPPEGYGLVTLGRQALSQSLDNVIGLVEVVVAPRSSLRGKSIRELEYKRRRRLHVLGIEHKGEHVTDDPLDHPLAMGDTLLLGGAWRDIDRLREHAQDVLVLALPREWKEIVPAFRRAPWALAIVAAMMVVMVTGWVPATIAVLATGVALVASGCLSMPQAYRAVNWQSLVLIAGMLPMGKALAKTGALDVIVDGLVGALGGVGPVGLMAALFLLTAILSQVISNTATAVLIAPVAIGVAEGLGVSARPLVMAVAMAASAAFVTPVASPVNTLVLGPGGYRFGDFVKIGLPLLVLTMVIVLLVVPLVFPY